MERLISFRAVAGTDGGGAGGAKVGISPLDPGA
jgi:hypothetical protein